MRHLRVSIPVGFSWSLRHYGSCARRRKYPSVSIPVGFSWSLRLPERSISGWSQGGCFNPCRVFLVVATMTALLEIIAEELEFQSLSGFLGRCDRAFSGSPHRRRTQFQSLSGFLGRCDVGITNSGFSGPSCFNPCRVFLVVATGSDQSYTEADIMFQSLSGFLGRCDHLGRWPRSGRRTGFNPCRVFLVVATILAEVEGKALDPSFNPCRVFLVVATVDPDCVLRRFARFQSLSGFLGRCD